MSDLPVVSVLVFDDKRCTVRGSKGQLGALKVHCDNGAVYPVDPRESLARIGSMLIKGSREFVDRLQQPTHQETPDMDRSIARKPNPADRLEQACGHLADAKVGFDEERLARQLTLLVEALREEAGVNESFRAALDQIADATEARVAHLKDAA